MKRWLNFSYLVLLASLLLPGCSTNPVTGQNELSLVSTEQELAIGRKNYSPYRQAQGGDYVVDPGIAQYVAEVGNRLAKVSDRELPYEFSVVNESTPNAWALPGGKIAVNRGLLVELNSEAELAAVLSHEIVHAAARHTARGINRSLLLQGALIATNIALSENEYRQLAMTGAQLGAGMVNQKYGRDAEREADYYGMHYMSRAGYDPASAVELQKTFVRLSKDQQSNWLTGLFASHPPSQERVENNQKTLSEVPIKNGETASSRYQQKIARLIKKKPAYEAYDKAKKALEENRHTQALTLVNQAIRKEPKEALFHGLKGEIEAAKGNKKAAKQHLDRAISLNPEYFKHYLARGFVERDLGNHDNARRDLLKSNQLLPTTEGNYGLGWIAMKEGKNQQAISYFRQAANNDTVIGKAAGSYLAHLDLANNPDRYISTHLGLDTKGFLIVNVHNQSPVNVRNVRIVIGTGNRFGLQVKGAFRLRQSLKPNQQIRLKTDIGPLDSQSASRFMALVTDATVN